ncbi:hypothetical protein [Neptuniibacter halophilus]|uniref:hypothetical protein n=1 Tax=Neptuniibacter halophilus TaxID=651666 RepID=UPI00257402D0|nr:hypothetical protein [Neptuniibacter halophilus]
MKMTEKEYQDLMVNRTRWNAKLGHKGKPKPAPMRKPSGKPEVQLDLNMGAADFGIEDDKPQFLCGVLPSAQLAAEEQEHQIPRTESFFVPYMAPSLNAIYAGIHWAKRKKHADAGHQACEPLRITPFYKPVHIIFLPIVGKRAIARDCSNYAYAAKVVEDGLVQAGILQDDTNEFVKSITIEEPVKDRSVESGMWVHIQEVGEWSGQRWMEGGKYPWQQEIA